MKKCFTINPLRSKREIESYYDLFRNNIYQGIEIFYPYNQDSNQYMMYTDSIDKLLATFRDLEVVMHLPHGSKSNLCDLEDFKEITNIMKSGMDYSNQFSVKKLTLHLGIVDNTKDRSIYLNHINDVLIDLCDYASKYKMDIMIENMPGIKELGYSPKEILNIIKNTNRSNLKFILDTGHANVSEYTINDYVEELKDYLIHLHLSDNSGIRDEHAKLGKGNIDFYEFFDLMKKINYRDLFCLEILFNDKTDLIDNARELDIYDK